jgi:hypothetical protein
VILRVTTVSDNPQYRGSSGDTKFCADPTTGVLRRTRLDRGDVNPVLYDNGVITKERTLGFGNFLAASNPDRSKVPTKSRS